MRFAIDIQKLCVYSMGMSTNNNIIDLFCGCGGFGLGAHLAGYKSVLSVDLDKTLSSSYLLNFPNANLKHLDLSKTTGKQLLNACNNQKIQGIIGGPPCQGFSMMGKRDESDPRNELIGHFFEQIRFVKPAFFIMENVPGLLAGPMRDKLEKQLKRMAEEYAIIGPIKVDAASLGAATKRQRVLVIGYKSKEFTDFSEKDIAGISLKKPVTVRDAISDLPNPIDCEEKEWGWNRYDGRRKASEYALKAREPAPKDCGWKSALEKLEEGYVSGLMNTIHTKEIEKRYRTIECGTTDAVSRSYKLDWEGQCPTLRAGTGSDKGSYQAVRPLHPEQGRVITVREAARLQGFPDWFVFHPTKWHSFRMIGNSVSPHLSRSILSLIKENERKALKKAA